MKTEQASQTSEKPKQAKRYTKRQPLTLDEITVKHSGFRSFADLCDALGNYRPTIYVKNPERRRLADAYDAVMSYKGDERRAYRVAC